MSHEPDSFAHEADQRLSRLFAAYREACPDPEPGANFTPRLWEMIEARQMYATGFQRLARTIITAAVAASLMMGIYWAVPENRSVAASSTYLELLAGTQNQGQEAIGEAEIVAAVHESNK